MRATSKDIQTYIRLRKVPACANCLNVYLYDDTSNEVNLACEKFDFYTELDLICDHRERGQGPDMKNTA